MQDTTLPANAIKMIDYLRESIHSGSLVEGNRIPSIRTLMSEFNVSLGSAKRALDCLSGMNLIETVPGKGTFVKSRPSYEIPNAEFRIMVFLLWSESNQGIFSEIFHSLQEAASRKGYSLLFTYLGYDLVSNEEVAKISKGTNGIIMLGDYDRTLSDLTLPIPVVTAGWHNTLNGKVSLFDIDPFHAAELAVKYFAERGKRKVYVFTVDIPALKNRANIFMNQWKETGNEAEIIISKEATDFSDMDHNCGYLFTSGWLLQRNSEKCDEQFGQQLSEVYQVLGIDGRSLIDHTYHPAPCITTDWRLMGKRILEECVNRIKTPGRIPARTYFPCTLHLPPGM